MRHSILALIQLIVFPLVCISCSSSAEDDVVVTPPEQKTEEGNGGYLFAHMTKAYYGKLFYSVSRDGKKWETLNEGKYLFHDYLGHPNIMRGGDGVYYMIGVTLSGTERQPILWYSDDLVVWKHRDLKRSIFDVSAYGYANEDVYLGAPKIFYDEDSQQYMITWHAFKMGLNEGQPHWESMRTFYILTKDWKTFSTPQRLFNFTGADAEMATIDAFIVKEKGTYYAIIKDERWPTTISSGKTVRIAKSESLTGPYSNPGNSISNAWEEAPTVVRKLDGKGWYLFTEKYNIAQYTAYEATSLGQTPWQQVTITPPTEARHGDVIQIDEQTYQAIVKAYRK